MGLQLEILSWEVHFIIMNTKSLFCPACSPPLPWEPLQLKLRLTPSFSLVPWPPLTTPWLLPTAWLRRRSSSPRSAHPPLRTSAPKRPSRLRRLSTRRSARRLLTTSVTVLLPTLSTNVKLMLSTLLVSPTLPPLCPCCCPRCSACRPRCCPLCDRHSEARLQSRHHRALCRQPQGQAGPCRG